jgi:hypothetical protein
LNGELVSEEEAEAIYEQKREEQQAVSSTDDKANS